MPNGECFMRYRRSLTAVAALVLGAIALLASTGAASAEADMAGTAGRHYAAEARTSGLTAAEARDLQNRVNQQLAQTGGKQVAANKIEYAGGAYLLLGLPGEKYARELNQPVAVMPTCNSGWFCAWRGTAFTGDKLSGYYCSQWITMPWAGEGSWVNNQTLGTRAHFLDKNMSYFYTTDGAYSADAFYDWTPVYWVDPC